MATVFIEMAGKKIPRIWLQCRKMQRVGVIHA